MGRVCIAALWLLVGQVALAWYSVSVSGNVSISVSPLASAIDSSSTLTYTAAPLGANGTQITVYGTSIPGGLTLKLYPTNLPKQDSSTYNSTSPLDLSDAVGSANAKVFITLGAPGANRKATLNYVASVTWAVPAGILPAVTVTFTIQDKP